MKDAGIAQTVERRPCSADVPGSTPGAGSSINAQDVIEAMESRFRSGNGIPVKQARITREEWEAVMLHLTTLEVRAADGECREDVPCE